MAFPKVYVADRQIILLSGFDRSTAQQSELVPFTVIERAKLEKAARRHPYAVAFGYLAGSWVPGA